MGQNGEPPFRWRERGEGEPVLLLHGLLGAVEHWEASLRTLGRFCRPIALSLPLVEPGLTDLSLPLLADWVRRFLDAQGLSEAVVGGNSLGGHVALELALAYPARVSGLILTGSSGLFERGFTRGAPHRSTGEWVRERMEEILYNPSRVTPEWVTAVQRVVSTRGTALQLLQVARAAKCHNIEARLPAIAVPTCIIWGKDDRITPPEVAHRFHALIPGSDLFLLSQCGHAPMLEQPEAFNALVAAWLLRTRPRRRGPVRTGESLIDPAILRGPRAIASA
jgi:pimeloyl-ACP methyl ester carboxylesterase